MKTIITSNVGATLAVALWMSASNVGATLAVARFAVARRRARLEGR
jgi:hypothetical protein